MVVYSVPVPLLHYFLVLLDEPTARPSWLLCCSIQVLLTLLDLSFAVRGRWEPTFRRPFSKFFSQDHHSLLIPPYLASYSRLLPLPIDFYPFGSRSNYLWAIVAILDFDKYAIKFNKTLFFSILTLFILDHTIVKFKNILTWKIQRVAKGHILDTNKSIWNCTKVILLTFQC